MEKLVWNSPLVQ
jgi:hypothetical protein